MEMNKDLLAKAKETKTPEELFALAKENDVEMTEENAKECFKKLHPQSGEISDDELDTVSGGGCGGSELKPKFDLGKNVAFVISQEFNEKYYVHGTISKRYYENGAWFYEIYYNGGYKKVKEDLIV